jgi:hypothetical protein
MNLNGILSGLGQAAQQFFYKPQQTGQATPQQPNRALPNNIKSPVPMTPMTNQLNPGIKSPMAGNQVAQHPIQPSGFEQAIRGVQGFGQNIANAFHPQPIQGKNANTPWPTVQTAIQKAHAPNVVQANANVQRVPQQVLGTNTSAPGGTTPNITIPYSHGNQFTLPSALAQTLMNSFNNIGQATNAAQVLNHPADNPYRPGIDPASVNHNTMGRMEVSVQVT